MVSTARAMTSVVVLTGPTASGKTALALEAALATGAEVVNADSLVVVRGFNIGTAKPTREELARVPHHLVDVRDPDESFTAGDFYREARAAIDGIRARGRRAIVVGGTGFYLKALIYGLWDAPKSDPALRAELDKTDIDVLRAELERVDPEAAAKIKAADRYRLVRAVEIARLSGRKPSELEKAAKAVPPDPRYQLAWIDREPVELESRIAARTRQMLEAGLLDEVKALRERWPRASALGSVGYAQIVEHLEGRLKWGDVPAAINLATRQLVKKQRTWFKGQLGAIASRYTLPGDAAAAKLFVEGKGTATPPAPKTRP